MSRLHTGLFYLYNTNGQNYSDENRLRIAKNQGRGRKKGKMVEQRDRHGFFEEFSLEIGMIHWRCQDLSLEKREHSKDHSL